MWWAAPTAAAASSRVAALARRARPAAVAGCLGDAADRRARPARVHNKEQYAAKSPTAAADSRRTAAPAPAPDVQQRCLHGHLHAPHVRTSQRELRQCGRRLRRPPRLRPVRDRHLRRRRRRQPVRRRRRHPLTERWSSPKDEGRAGNGAAWRSRWRHAARTNATASPCRACACACASARAQSANEEHLSATTAQLGDRTSRATTCSRRRHRSECL